MKYFLLSTNIKKIYINIYTFSTLFTISAVMDVILYFKNKIILIVVVIVSIYGVLKKMCNITITP